MQEEDLFEIDVPLEFQSVVAARVHGLACWFDVLFDGRSIVIAFKYIFLAARNTFTFVIHVLSVLMKNTEILVCGKLGVLAEYINLKTREKT